MAKPDQERKGVQIPERSWRLLKWLSTETGNSIGSMIARAVDVYIKHRQTKGQWVPPKRELRKREGKP